MEKNMSTCLHDKHLKLVPCIIRIWTAECFKHAKVNYSAEIVASYTKG